MSQTKEENVTKPSTSNHITVTIHVVDGEEVSLTPKEYELLHLFAEHPRQVFTYEHLLETFWGGMGDKHIIRVHVARIRDKIEVDPNHPKYIVNVWGGG